MLTLVIVLAVLLLASLACLASVERRRVTERHEHANYRDQHPYTEADVAEHRSTAIKQSRSVVTGQAAEHLTPLIPEFLSEFNPRDWQWVGQPIDFLIWDGLEVGHLERLVMVEVKSGSTTRGGGLSKSQRQIRNLIERGRVPLEWRLVDLSDPSEPKMVE